MATTSKQVWRLRPNAPPSGRVLGDATLIAEGQAKEFTFGRGRSAFGMFVVLHEGRYRGYLNLCPHYSLPLNREPDRFLNDGQIECVQHFARFAVEDGRCLSGACEGEGLWPIAVAVDANGQLVIA